MSAPQRQPLVARTVAELRAALAPYRRAGATVGLVPTMGALHQGHLSLISTARERCELVVVSIFVNPSQFDEQADLLAYPRQEQRDIELAAGAGADVLFLPCVEEIYRPGFSTSVEVLGLTDRLEGAVRGAGHFRGVTTVVCKLLNIVAPQLAFFGRKDAQQTAVIRRMVRDLDIDAQIVTLPTVREANGLAMSSRNVRLSPQERQRALALSAALHAAEALADTGERSAQRLRQAAEAELAAHSVQAEYVALVDAESFEDVDRLQDEALLLIAARIGQTRLIDNLPLRVSARSQDPRQSTDQGDAIAVCSA
ncbi:MAG TPA: pantoate--beta-alanine ligase [Solirubrobacteraceae bacterium]|jgi:pantoate--beta-alanine ligase